MKKLKYILIALAVIVLCVGGYIIYELKFKSYDTADPEVDALIDESFELELPDGTVIIVDKEGNIVENKTTGSENGDKNGTGVVATESTNSSTGKETETSTNANVESSSIDSEKNDNSSKSTNGDSNQTKKPNNSDTSTTPVEKETVSTIKAKYENTFKMLESQSRSRLNSLVSQAANEYSTKKSNGESVSYGYFYKKYMGAAKGIESATDSTVKAVVGLVEKDLQANGFDKSYAQSFVKDYEVLKESLREEMMSKALNFR